MGDQNTHTHRFTTREDVYAIFFNMPQGNHKGKKVIAVPNGGKKKKQEALKKKAAQSKPKPAKSHAANHVKGQIQKAINANIELTCKQRASNEFSAFKILKKEVLAAGKEVKKGARAEAIAKC